MFFRDDLRERVRVHYSVLLSVRKTSRGGLVEQRHYMVEAERTNGPAKKSHPGSARPPEKSGDRCKKFPVPPVPVIDAAFHAATGRAGSCKQMMYRPQHRRS